MLIISPLLPSSLNGAGLEFSGCSSSSSSIIPLAQLDIVRSGGRQDNQLSAVSR